MRTLRTTRTPLWLFFGLVLVACGEQNATTIAGDGRFGDPGSTGDGAISDGGDPAGDSLRGDSLRGDSLVPSDADPDDPAPAVCGGVAGIYVSPTGSGVACGPLAPCSLAQAFALVRERNSDMSDDLVVCLHGGRYALDQTIVFGPADSGSNGYNVVYRAFPRERPLLSGAQPLESNWTLHDATRSVYVASVAGVGTRQLVVNGNFAQRARGPANPAGFTKTATGYSTSSQQLSGISRPEELEVVSFVEWKSFRCGVAAVSGNDVTMEQPCWNAANWHEARPIGVPAWIENALEYLDEPGEWFLDSSTGQLYYKPLSGEDLSRADVLLPRLESLVELVGTAANPVRDIHFVGLTFAHNTWLAPSSADGYAPLQAGMRLVYVEGSSTPEQQKSASALTVRYGQGIRFEENTFTLLGSAGLSLETGSRNNIIISNTFSEIAGSALQLSDVHASDHHPENPADGVQNNVIRGNVIRRVGLDYHDSLGIWAGYAGQTHVLHNQLSDLPYSAISLGWGWGAVDVGGAAGYTTPTPAQSNRVEGNRILDFMNILRDGGGVYALGAQAGSVIRGNSISVQHDDFAAIYLDNGARYFAVTENVVWNAPYWTYVQGWGTKAVDNRLTGNYYDSGSPQMSLDPPNETDSSNEISGNHKVYFGFWPSAAEEIIDKAGVENDLTVVREVATRAHAIGSTEYNEEYAASMANDNQLATGWSPTASDALPWLQLDLLTPLQIRAVTVTMRQDMDQPEGRKNFEIRISNDPDFGAYLSLGQQGATALPHQGSFTVSSQRTSAFRYLRIAKTQPGYLFVAEVAVEAVP